MGSITLSHEDSKKVLDNPDASPTARVIAACCIAFFEAKRHADEVDADTRAIALKLTHMTASAIYEGAE